MRGTYAAGLRPSVRGGPARRARLGGRAEGKSRGDGLVVLEHESAARVSEWLAPRLVGHERIADSEPVLASVVRIATHPRVFRQPSTPADALAFATSLASAPAALLVRPGPDHWPIVQRLVSEHRVRGNDIPDAVLAAHALELGASLVTLNRGFARFAPLRAITPLSD